MVTQDNPPTTFSSQVKRSVSVSAYKARFSDDGTYTYSGLAVPGTATSDAAWQIKRINNSTGDIDWAGGTLAFTKIWDNRASLSYS